MTPTANFALVSQDNRADVADVKRWAASIDAQFKEDLFPAWGRRATCIWVAKQSDIPHGFIPMLIQAQLDEPGALGYHTDEHNQPVCYIKFTGESTSITASHEGIETVLDMFGNRLIAVDDINGLGPCKILVEGCDPPEAISYDKNGSQVSDFILPEWYDAEKKEGVKYTFLDSIDQPRTILNGGYYSFIDSAGTWHQATWFDGDSPQFTTLGRREAQKGSLREWVDARTAKHGRTA